jgi:hypothetical protein
MQHEDTRRLQEVQSELVALKRRMAALEATHATCDARIRELHDQNTSLVQLTVASQLLAASLEREEVLGTIEEVIVNMIGSEELAIFDVDRDGTSLNVARLRGIDAASPRLARAFGPLSYVLRSGQTLVSRDRRVRADDIDGGLTAAIPLKVERDVTGVVAIFRLLDQKVALEQVDHDLFEILSRQAAMALHSTAFRSLRPTVRPPSQTVRVTTGMER